jgi:hypothetical protein
VSSTVCVRRFRQRKREGALLIKIEVDGLIRDELVKLGSCKNGAPRSLLPWPLQSRSC